MKIPKFFSNLLITIFFTGLFFFISTINLDAQGLYYDEVNFAPPALTFRGINSDYSVSTSFKGLPVFILSYQGAVMSYPYGIYLKLFNQDFSVLSWRLYGIIIWSFSLLFFSIFSSKFLRTYQLTIFLAFLLTDISLILAIRFNQGPVLIPLVTDLIIILAAVKISRRNILRGWELFFLGFSIGLAIYAKFSSYPLILPLLLMLIYLSIKKYINKKGLLTVIGGFLIGSFPISIYNLHSLLLYGSLFSFYSIENSHLLGWKDLLNKFILLLTSSTGNDLYERVFDEKVPNFFNLLEIFFLYFFILLTFASILSFKKSRTSITFYLFTSCILSFLLLYISPMQIYTRHTLILAPFLYFSISTFFESLSKNLTGSIKFLKICSMTLLLLWIAIRIIQTYQLFQNFMVGKYSMAFHPDYTKLGKFAEKKSDDSLFITADWGFGHQLFLLTGGKEKTVYELNFDYQNINDLKDIVRGSKKNNLYLISYIDDENSANPDISKKIFQNAASADFLTPIQSDIELSTYEIINIKKYKIIKEKL